MRNAVNAYLSFGMVNVKVGVSPSTNRQADPEFKNLHAPCKAPVAQEMVCTSCGKEHLRPDELLKGYRLSKDQFVTFTLDEHRALKPERSSTIQLKGFMTLEKLPNSIEGSWWLTPDPIFVTAYSVLYDALTATGLWGVGTCCLWGKERICAVGPDSGVLRLDALTAPSAIVEPDFELPAAPKAEVEMAIKLLQAASQHSVSLDALEPSFAAEVAAAVQAKLAGETIERQAIIQPEPTIDLMAALKASVAEMTPKKRKKQAA